jgi:hypothetical protein
MQPFSIHGQHINLNSSVLPKHFRLKKHNTNQMAFRAFDSPVYQEPQHCATA